MPWALLLKPSVILFVLLSISVAGNWTLFKMRDAALKHIGAVTAERDQAIGAAQQCSEGTKQLQKAAAERDKKLRAAVAAADEKAKVAALAAQATLQLQPAHPTDLCLSAVELSRDKLKVRQERLRALAGQ